MVPGDRLPPPASLARRHFVGIVAAGAARLSALAISSALLTGRSASAMGILPIGDPHRGYDHDHDHDHDRDHRGHNHNCFLRGALILTVRGEIPVEDLAIGELVVTTNGALPIKWVGRTPLRRSATASWPAHAMPIRVARHALNDQTPRRDLYLSQGHSLFIDGRLIPVKHLVNERSIALDYDAQKSEIIEYFSIELDSHQVVFAEGTAAETFRYSGGQIPWDNLGDYRALYGHEHNLMPSFASLCRYSGGRAEVGALLRLAASPFVDLRDPIQHAYAGIAARAMSVVA